MKPQIQKIFPFLKIVGSQKDVQHYIEIRVLVGRLVDKRFNFSAMTDILLKRIMGFHEKNGFSKCLAPLEVF